MKKYRNYWFSTKFTQAVVAAFYVWAALMAASYCWGSLQRYEAVSKMVSFGSHLAAVDTALDKAKLAIQRGRVTQAEYACIAKILCEELQAMQVEMKGEEYLIYSHRCVEAQRIFMRLRTIFQKNIKGDVLQKH